MEHTLLQYMYLCWITWQWEDNRVRRCGHPQWCHLLQSREIYSYVDVTVEQTFNLHKQIRNSVIKNRVLLILNQLHRILLCYIRNHECFQQDWLHHFELPFFTLEFFYFCYVQNLLESIFVYLNSYTYIWNHVHPPIFWFNSHLHSIRLYVFSITFTHCIHTYIDIL